ncbi:MAG: DUF3105 domain-containing protein, partial [Euryarchaeota archaeon]|nr:DUF3105 domain-containing protein [Euryarchaeota archaeon]
EIQVHNLEHGGIMVQYRPGLDPATVDRLRAQVQRYRSKVILAPYPGLAGDIVLTAWTRLDAFNGYDEARITRFIATYMDKGPEKVPD